MGQDLYKDSLTVVICTTGMPTASVLFAVVINRLTDEARQKSLWNIMFAGDDLCSEPERLKSPCFQRTGYSRSKNGKKRLFQNDCNLYASKQ